MRTTVLIVDDHADFRVLARQVLQAEGFDVVGEAWDGPSALDASRRLHPDLVLLDVQLPGEDGFQVCATLVGEPCAPQVVMTSSRDAASYSRRLASSEARGFIPKAELSGPRLMALVGAT